MLILDAGAFVAAERGDRDVVALVKRERLCWQWAADRMRSTPLWSAWLRMEMTFSPPTPVICAP